MGTSKVVIAVSNAMAKVSEELVPAAKVVTGRGCNGQSYGCNGGVRLIGRHNPATDVMAVVAVVWATAPKVVAVVAEMSVVAVEVVVAWTRY